MISISYDHLSKEELITVLKDKDKVMEKLKEELEGYRKLNLSQDHFIKQTELEKIIEKTPIGFCVTDKKGYFELVNSAYCDIYSYTEEELLGEHFSIVATEDNKEKLTELHDNFISGNSELRGEWEVVDKLGNRKIILADATRIKGSNDEYKKVTFVIDITKRKKLEEKLKQANDKLQEKAAKDGLTGLYNHREIMRKLNLEIERADRYNLDLTIMMLDIDDFKEVNDTYGHQKGDEILQSLAQKLKSITRQEDIVGRYGGEEFLIIFPHTDLDSALEVGERLCQKIADDKTEGIKITISGGVATLTAEQSENIIQNADEALYQAKKAGKNQIMTAKE